MQLGNYADGRALNYDERSGAFDIGGAAVSADQIRGWDAAGQIAWASDDMKAEFTRLSSAPVAAIPALSKKRMSVKTIAILAIAGACAIGALIDAVSPSDEGQRADAEDTAAVAPEPASEPSLAQQMYDTVEPEKGERINLVDGSLLERMVDASDANPEWVAYQTDLSVEGDRRYLPWTFADGSEFIIEAIPAEPENTGLLLLNVEIVD